MAESFNLIPIEYTETRGGGVSPTGEPNLEDLMAFFDNLADASNVESTPEDMSDNAQREAGPVFLKSAPLVLNKGLQMASGAVHGVGGEISRRQVLRKIGIGVLAGVGSSYAQPVSSALSREEGFSTIERPPIGVQEHIHFEIVRALRLLTDTDPLRALESSYLVETLYYSDAFLKKLEEGPKENVGSTIVSEIAQAVSPEVRIRFAKALAQKAEATLGVQNESLLLPFKGIKIDTGKGENHLDAIDLFTPEGTPVSLMQSGITILSESNWTVTEPFSTSSFKGGNVVIAYAPQSGEFYRYCHLDKVESVVGACAEAGTVIGTVGHTGQNAVLPGHGGHLHLEINHLDMSTGNMLAVPADMLRKRLASIVAA